MALTDVKCRGAKPGKVRQKLSDGGGLQLWIQPNGSRLWQLIYQYEGKQAQMALGPYPQVSLLDARTKRDEVKGKIRAGINPAEEKRAAEAVEQQPGDTFKEIALEFIAKCRRDNLAGPTMIKKEWLLDFAYPTLGAKRVSEIRPVDVLKVVQDVEFKGNYETARRLKSTIGQVCRYAVATSRAEFDPTPVLRGAITPPKVTPRAAIIEPEKFGGLLRAIDGFDGHPTTVAALKLMALLFPRPGELRFAEWIEFDFNKSLWTIPAAKTKMRREHRVFLAPQAIEVLEDLRKITGHRKLLFPSFHGGVLGSISDSSGVLPANAPRLLRAANDLLSVGIVWSLAVLITWVAFGPGARHFSVTGGGLSVLTSGSGDTIGRVAFGIGSIMCWCVAAAVTAMTVRRWRR